MLLVASIGLNAILYFQGKETVETVATQTTKIEKLEEEVLTQKSTISSQKTEITSQKYKIASLEKKGSYFDTLCKELSSGNIGYAASNFKASESVIIVNKNETNERIVVCDKDGAETIVQFDSDAYERAKKIYADFLKQEVKGTYPVIDATWALDVIEKFEKQKVQVPDFTGLLDQWLLEEQKKNLTKSDVSQQAQKDDYRINSAIRRYGGDVAPKDICTFLQSLPEATVMDVPCAWE